MTRLTDAPLPTIAEWFDNATPPTLPRVYPDPMGDYRQVYPTMTVGEAHYRVGPMVSVFNAAAALMPADTATFMAHVASLFGAPLGTPHTPAPDSAGVAVEPPIMAYKHPSGVQVLAYEDGQFFARVGGGAFAGGGMQ